MAETLAFYRDKLGFGVTFLVHVPDPDALARELTARGVSFSAPLEDTHDGLRGFELEDVNGYVLFLGRPRAS